MLVQIILCFIFIFIIHYKFIFYGHIPYQSPNIIL